MRSRRASARPAGAPLGCRDTHERGTAPRAGAAPPWRCRGGAVPARPAAAAAARRAAHRTCPAVPPAVAAALAHGLPCSISALSRRAPGPGSPVVQRRYDRSPTGTSRAEPMEGRLLSRGSPQPPDAVVLRPAARYRGDQQHLLPDAVGENAGPVGRAGAGRLPLRAQGLAPHYPRAPTARRRPTPATRTGVLSSWMCPTTTRTCTSVACCTRQVT